MLPGRNDTGQNDEAKGIWNVSLLQNARRNCGSIFELTVESSGTTTL